MFTHSTFGGVTLPIITAAPVWRVSGNKALFTCPGNCVVHANDQHTLRKKNPTHVCNTNSRTINVDKINKRARWKTFRGLSFERDFILIITAFPTTTQQPRQEHVQDSYFSLLCTSLSYQEPFILQVHLPEKALVASLQASLSCSVSLLVATYRKHE